MVALLDEWVRLEARLRCIRSFADLFQKLFAVRCSSHLSHLDEPGANPLILPVTCGGTSCRSAPNRTWLLRKEIDETCLVVMEEGLNLDSIACQESALHGIGHWQPQYPQRAEHVINAFLGAHPELRLKLLSDARSARRGCVQQAFSGGWHRIDRFAVCFVSESWYGRSDA